MVTGRMLNRLSVIFLFVLIISCSTQTKKENWIQLFNGKDLDNWDIKFKGHELGDNYKNTFRVEDGLLKVRYDNWDTFDNVFGHIFYTGEFSRYKLRAVYRFVGDQIDGGPGWAYQNNGIMIHGQTAESMGLDQDFPVSLEVQLLGGNGTDERTTGNLCTPGTNVVFNGELYTPHIANSSSKTYHGDQWVTAEVEVYGSDSIKHFVNGELVLQYKLPQLDTLDENARKLIPSDGNLILSNGTISLQAESHPIDFRKVELLKLD